MLRRACQRACRAFGNIRAPQYSGAALGVGARQYATSLRNVFGSSSTNTAALCLTAFAASLAFAPSVCAATMYERSFIMVKPDGVHRGLVGEIIKRFEQKGYKLVGIKVIVPSKETASQHYAEHNGKPFFPKLVNFLSSGPVVAMVWEGKEVIKYGRAMIGATNPLVSAPGTIRGDYGVDVGRNIIHGSDSVESAQKEIALWFQPQDLAEYTPVAQPWIYE